MAVNQHAILVIAITAAVSTQALATQELRLETADLATLAPGERIQLDAVPLGDAERVDLTLERFDVVAPGAKLVRADHDGESAFDRSRVVLLRGAVVGAPGSHVFLGVAPTGAHGYVQRDGVLRFLSTGPGVVPPGALVLRPIDPADLPAPTAWCQVEAGDPRFAPLGPPAVANGAPDPTDGGDPPCRSLRVAVDTDWEFTRNLFGGDTDASADYALVLLAGVSEIFQRDVNATLIVSFLRVWANNSDPYDAENTGDALRQLRDHWRANHGDVEREVAHLLSGEGLGGGVAYLNVTCSTQWGYAVSANLGGSFPYPLRHNDHGNWDPFVVAHELGHNFGTLHTHDGYEPPLDRCGLGDCENADRGTIMSYCHTCSGGMSNIRLEFHPAVIDRIDEYLDGVPCEVTCAPCEADLDDSGAVDFGDVLAVLAAWGNTEGPEDLDDDGLVGFGDLLEVLSRWGACA